jgi:hypothetical protein
MNDGETASWRMALMTGCLVGISTILTPPHLTTPLLEFPLTHPRLHLILLLTIPPPMILHN